MYRQYEKGADRGVDFNQTAKQDISVFMPSYFTLWSATMMKQNYFAWFMGKKRSLKNWQKMYFSLSFFWDNLVHTHLWGSAQYIALQTEKLWSIYSS